MPTEPSALDLLRAAGLLADGPVAFGQPVRSRKAGIFLVELPRGVEAAPIESRSIAAWLARVPDLRLDGERPTQAELTARLASFWFPNQRLLYVGRTAKSLHGRVAALYSTELGHRRPHSGGYWLKTLQSIEQLRVWWADTEAPEEYEDAVLSQFAEAVPVADRGTLPAGQPVLPWAVLETGTGERRETGIANPFIDHEAATAPAGRGTASEAAGGAGRAKAAASTATRTTRAAAARTSARAAAARASTLRPTSGTRRNMKATTAAPQAASTHVTASGLASIEAELEQLRTIRRPEVILRVKNARELGDLRENAEYQEARNEQSFLEGRVQALEQKVRSAVVIESGHDGEVVLGATVKVGIGDEEMTFHIVGSTEADPSNGRISNASPVGKALIGHREGETVIAHLPGRVVEYRILKVG